MISLSLSPEDADVLRDALSTYHRSLLLEIAKADNLAFRQGLRAREDVVARLLAHLAPDAAA